MSRTPSDKLRARWLQALLPRVPFDGWSEIAAEEAAAVADLSAGEQALAAPNGVIDLLQAYFDTAEADTRQALSDMDMSDLRTPERVAVGIRTWLSVLEPNREAVRKAVQLGFLPWRTGPALKRAWSVADMIWEKAGDTATDYNHYSKRGLLTSVMPSIINYWLEEPEEDALDDFIMKRLKQVSGIGAKAGKLAKPILDRLPIKWTDADEKS